MRSIVFVLLEARDTAAARILTALSEAGVGDHVKHVFTREGLRSALGGGPVDAVVASASIPGHAPLSIVEDARAIAPSAPIILVVDPPFEDAFDWLAGGASACVPAYRIDRLAPAITRVVADADRRREEATIARTRDDFLARVAHQLRTPQSALLGWTALLAGKRLDEAARARALETIARNARIQARMLDDLLDVSRLITGTLDLDLLEIDACPAIAAAAAASRHHAEEAGVALTVEMDDAAGAVLVDPRRLDQIARELMANAVRATPRGGRVSVHLGREGDTVIVSVHDTGRGIAPAALPLIFDGLTRAARPAHHGLGVGLWIVRRLVEALHGTVIAESPGEGLGATFTMRLPAIPR